jgi:hypothetical protein
MPLLTACGEDEEIEIEIYETISGRYVDTTADIAVVEDGLGLVFKIDVEAEKFRKCINKQN